MRRKLDKHHVEDGEDYNRVERRHLYIVITLYYINISLSLQNQLSPTTRFKIK